MKLLFIFFGLFDVCVKQCCPTINRNFILLSCSNKAVSSLVFLRFNFSRPEDGARTAGVGAGIGRILSSGPAVFPGDSVLKTPARKEDGCALWAAWWVAVEMRLSCRRPPSMWEGPGVRVCEGEAAYWGWSTDATKSLSPGPCYWMPGGSGRPGGRVRILRHSRGTGYMRRMSGWVVAWAKTPDKSPPSGTTHNWPSSWVLT